MKLTSLVTCLGLAYFLAEFCNAGTVTISGVEINYVNRGSQTDFTVRWPQPAISVNNIWLGIGLNANNRMDGASAIICQSSGGNTAVTHYLNSGFSSNYIDPSNLAVGTSNPSVTTTNGEFVCSFTRDNSNNVAGYYNLNTNTSPYIILAYGTQGSGKIGFHSGVYKRATTVSLTVEATTTPLTTTTLVAASTVPVANQTSISTTASPITTTAASTTTTTVAPAFPDAYYSFGFSTDNKMVS